MTDKETLDRINEEADKYGFRVPYDGTQNFYDESAVKGYLTGAKSERNKVLDEVIEIISSYRSLDRTQLKEILESLKL